MVGSASGNGFVRDHVAAFRFCFMVLKTGRLLYCRNKAELIDLRDQVMKNYLDFKYFRDSFDRTFLKEIGYNG